jgi:hypothetical protein
VRLWSLFLLLSSLPSPNKSRKCNPPKLPKLNTTTGCSNAQLVSALDSADAGTTNIGQVFANGFPPELVNAAFGQELASEDVKRRMTPVGTGSNWGPEECLKRCEVTKPGAA